MNIRFQWTLHITALLPMIIMIAWWLFFLNVFNPLHIHNYLNHQHTTVNLTFLQSIVGKIHQLVCKETRKKDETMTEAEKNSSQLVT